MIQDIRLHGQINDRVEYFATVAGRDIANRYFHESGEKDGKSFVRFFSYGNDLKINPEGISYFANGGSFCEYMFGIDLPIKDLIKKDVLNRLVMYGGVYSEGDRLSFTNDIQGGEDFTKVFMNGNAVSNYYFFVHSDSKLEHRKRQETLLRALGKYLKHTDKVGKSDDSAIVRDIFLALKEDRSIVFLVRLVNRFHEDYHRTFKELYWKNRAVDEDGIAKLAALANLYEIDRYQQERIKIDIMYKHPENKRIVDEYKAILIGCSNKKEIDHLDMAKLTRLRTLSLRNKIPLNLFDTLDEMLLKGKKIKEVNEPEYIKETRAIFEGLFLKGQTAGHINGEDMTKLLRAKQHAILLRDNTFEEILLETCRLTDEKSIESNDLSLFESFGYIITYFDRFDTTLATVSQISFMEGTIVTEEKLRSLLGNKRAFDEISKGLFHELFIKSALQNRYMTNYGRRKATALYNGIMDIEEGNASVKEVIERLNAIIAEERDYVTVHAFMKEKLKHSHSDLADRETQDLFIADVWKEMLDGGHIQHGTPEKVFRDALINIRKEIFYLHHLLPVIIAGSSTKTREDFLENSGLDRFYIEELERDYFEKNRISGMLLERLRKDEQPTASAGQ